MPMVCAVPKAARRGAGWGRFARRTGGNWFGSSPERYVGRGFRLLSAGWKWDGTVGHPLADWVGLEYTNFRRYGTGGDR